MENQFIRKSAYSLLLGSALATLTMVIHPTGGDMNHILHLRGMLVQSHSIAIFCLPFIGFGFWGISAYLQTESRISILAFMISFLGLIAAMIGASINGLVLPQFVENYHDSKIDHDTLKAILDYGRYINISMTYLFIVAILLSVSIWCYLVIITERLPKLLGYTGFFLVASGFLGMMLHFNFASLSGFRVAIFGMVVWELLAGFFLLREVR